jgi:hypothetical protein
LGGSEMRQTMAEKFSVRVLAIAVTVAVGACVAFRWFNNTNNPRLIAGKCETRIKQSVDPGALQEWATKLLAQYPVGRTNNAGPFDAPSYLIGIWPKGPPDVYLKGGYRGEEPYVYVFWGGGAIGHWGLSVGSRTFVPMNSGYSVRQWKPGVYFFEDFR